MRTFDSRCNATHHVILAIRNVIGNSMKFIKTKAVILLALIATCMFGRMAWLAGVGAFENPSPSKFERLEAFWTALYWLIPALLVGVAVSRGLIIVAAGVKFFSSSFLMALEYPSFVPVGGYLPDPPWLLLAMIEELVTATLLAVLLAWLVHVSSNKIKTKFGQV